MRSKLNFLINMSLKKKIKTKWFLIANIIIAIIMIGIINIDSIVTQFGGDFDASRKIYVVDQTEKLSQTFKFNLEESSKTLYKDATIYEIIITSEKTEDLKNKIKEEENSSLLIEFKEENNKVNPKLVSLSTIDTYDYQLINAAVSSTISLYNLSSIKLTEEEYNKLTQQVELEREILDSEITSESENVEMIMTTVFPILILPFFMLTIFLVQFIGNEINDEKSTRSMEIIISNVSPKTHFISKIISNNLFIIFQVILIILYVVVALGIRKLIGGDTIINGITAEVGSAIKLLSSGMFNDKFVLVLIFTIILMILTFIAYSLVAGILASMTTNSEDYQQVQIPLVIVLLLGYYLSIMAGMFKGATFIKILSFIPFISAILSPSLLVMGQIGLIEIIISVILMIITIFILIKYGLRIYKVGILNYSSTGLWKKMFKSLRNK